MSTRRRSALALTVLFVLGLATVATVPATAVTPTEDFATFSAPGMGELDGTAFTVTGCGVVSLGTSDLTGPDFLPAGSATQATNGCTTSTGITIALEQALDGVDVYLVGLPYGVCADGVYTLTTDAAGPLTISSGFSGSSIVGSTLTVPFTTPNSGVIHLAGPVTYLILQSQATFAGTLTLGTTHVEPTTTTTSSTTSTTSTVPAADVAAAGATADPVTPAFAC